MIECQLQELEKPLQIQRKKREVLNFSKTNFSGPHMNGTMLHAFTMDTSPNIDGLTQDTLTSKWIFQTESVCIFELL